MSCTESSVKIVLFRARAKLKQQLADYHYNKEARDAVIKQIFQKVMQHVRMMTTPENRDQLQQLLIQYLYGDMDEAERADFGHRVEGDATLRAMLDAELRFDSSLPRGMQPLIDADRLQGNRWLLHQNLQRERNSAFSLQRLLRGMAERPLTVVFQGAAMAATFVLGLLIASPQIPPVVGPVLAEAAFTPLDFVQDEDFEIFEFKVN